MTLKVDPGASCAWMALFMSGWLGSVMTWFLVLVLSAALMAPAGVWLGRIAGGTLGRWIAGVGIAAATVQVVGTARQQHANR